MSERHPPKVGVILSGCGVSDGAEIHEATLLLLALDRAGAKAVCFAPDADQAQVVDHRTGRLVSGEPRNALAEAARIARGAISPLGDARVEALDALAFPGGFGVALNLSTYARQGAAMALEPQVEALLQGMHRARKPMGFICIAPVLAARALGAHHPRLTIGRDTATARHLEAMGAVHVEADADQVVIDEAQRLVSTPAYMLASSIGSVSSGIERLVGALLSMAASA